MDFLLFDRSAIEVLVSKSEYQSTEYYLGDLFMQVVLGNVEERLEGLYYRRTDKGIVFSGKRCEFSFL